MKSLCTKGVLYFSLALLVVAAAACTQSRPSVPTPTLVPLVNETVSPPSNGQPTPIIIEQPTAAGEATLVIPLDQPTETPVPAVGDATPIVDPNNTAPTPILVEPTLLPTPTTVGDVAQPVPTTTDGTTTGQPTGGACSSPYTVKAGEWFLLIARNCGVTAGQLQAANPGLNPNLLRPGQVINIPGGGSTGGNAPPPTQPTATSGGQQPPPSNGSCSNPYVVQRGDTLYSIATRCGTTVIAIQQANGIPAPEYIFPGQQLQIP